MKIKIFDRAAFLSGGSGENPFCYLFQFLETTQIFQLATSSPFSKPAMLHLSEPSSATASSPDYSQERLSHFKVSCDYTGPREFGIILMIQNNLPISRPLI